MFFATWPRTVNQFRARVTPGKINGKWAVFCSIWKQSEIEREPHYRFCKKSLISGKRINTLPVVGVSRNQTLLVGSGQDSVVLAQAFESLRFPLEQGESFSDLICLTCARQPVRLASSVSNSTSPCNEQTWNAKGTDTIMTSPEHEAPKTCTKRSTALRSPTIRRQEFSLFPLPSSPLDQRHVHRFPRTSVGAFHLAYIEYIHEAKWWRCRIRAVLIPWVRLKEILLEEQRTKDTNSRSWSFSRVRIAFLFLKVSSHW